MIKIFEISDEELREIYKLLSKDELIELIIKKSRECNSLLKQLPPHKCSGVLNTSSYEN